VNVGATRACAWAVLGVSWTTACASLPSRPPESLLAELRAARSYRAELGVKLRGPNLRGRAQVLIACERPDRLRLEVPGPGGVRLVAVAEAGRLLAVFPAEAAYYRAAADREELRALLGLELTPAEVMDLLLGLDVPSAREQESRWGPRLPTRVEATLADGARVRAVARAPELDPDLPRAAFELTWPAGYRALSRDELQSLWSRP